MPTNNPGSVYQRQDGKWCAALQVNGKRKVLYGNTEKEARKKLADLQRQVATSGGLPDAGKRTVNDLLDLWLQTVRPSLKPRTVAEYEGVCHRYIRPAIGVLRLGKLSPERVQAFYADLQEKGLKRAPQEAHVALHSALKMAVLWRWLPENVTERVVRPRYRAERQEVWTREELGEFLGALAGNPHGPLWVLAISTGCRLSELLGLRWDEVNRATGRITIRRTLQRINGKVLECTPKTAAGERAISLPADGLAALSRQKAVQAELRLKAGPAWRETHLVFTGERGQPLQPSTVEHALQRVCERTGIRRVSPHNLRHLHASLLLGAGLPVPEVSARLGHANPSVTMAVYAHSLKRHDERAADAIQQALSTQQSGLTEMA